jgi:hypothetical protein
LVPAAAQVPAWYPSDRGASFISRKLLLISSKFYCVI